MTGILLSAAAVVAVTAGSGPAFWPRRRRLLVDLMGHGLRLGSVVEVDGHGLFRVMSSGAPRLIALEALRWHEAIAIRLTRWRRW